MDKNLSLSMTRTSAKDSVLIASKKQSSSVIDTKDGFIAFGMAVFSLILYIRTLVPGLLPGDSGEFQTLAYSVDHAHTTGYEVYILLAKLFTLIVPVNDVAYRVNLLVGRIRGFDSCTGLSGRARPDPQPLEWGSRGVCPGDLGNFLVSVDYCKVLQPAARFAARSS